MRRAAGNHYSPYGNGGTNNGGDTVLEGENDRMTDELKGKIHSLKSLTIDIGSEVRDQNKYLRDMDDDFDSAGGFLGKAMGRVKKLASSHQSYIALYLILFSCVVFFLIWIITKFN